MPTLKFKIKDFDFEFIGDHKEMIEFIQALMTSTENVTSMEKITHKASQNMPLDMPLPQFEDVLAFIVSQQDFKHTLYDVQRHFFKRTFITTDKSTLPMYLKTIDQLKKVRKEIEKRHHGKFEKKRGKGRLDYYTFKKEEKTTQVFA